jgi:hypothetical protein
MRVSIQDDTGIITSRCATRRARFRAPAEIHPQVTEEKLAKSLSIFSATSIHRRRVYRCQPLAYFTWTCGTCINRLASRHKTKAWLS